MRMLILTWMIMCTINSGHMATSATTVSYMPCPGTYRRHHWICKCSYRAPLHSKITGFLSTRTQSRYRYKDRHHIVGFCRELFFYLSRCSVELPLGDITSYTSSFCGVSQIRREWWLICISLCVISDDRTHSAVVVHAFIKEILQEVLRIKHNLKFVHYFSIKTWEIYVFMKLILALRQNGTSLPHHMGKAHVMV